MVLPRDERCYGGGPERTAERTAFSRQKRKVDTRLRRKARYDSSLPGRMYRYFVGYGETGAPSFAKFARLSGYTTAQLEGFRKHKSFDSAWRECSEIRRDYLIDTALTKRHDPSFCKFLLTELEPPPETDCEDMKITVEVIED